MFTGDPLAKNSLRTALRIANTPGVPWSLRVVMSLLSRVVGKLNSQDAIRDGVTFASGLIGLSKRLAKGKARAALEAADAVIDKMHEELGEAVT